MFNYLFSLFVLFNNFKTNIYNNKNLIVNIIKNKNIDGYDNMTDNIIKKIENFKKNNTGKFKSCDDNNTAKIKNLSNIFYKYELLKKLESNILSNEYKLQLIYDNDLSYQLRPLKNSLLNDTFY